MVRVLPPPIVAETMMREWEERGDIEKWAKEAHIPIEKMRHRLKERLGLTDEASHPRVVMEPVQPTAPAAPGTTQRRRRQRRSSGRLAKLTESQAHALLGLLQLAGTDVDKGVETIPLYDEMQAAGDNARKDTNFRSSYAISVAEALAKRGLTEVRREEVEGQRKKRVRIYLTPEGIGKARQLVDERKDMGGGAQALP